MNEEIDGLVGISGKAVIGILFCILVGRRVIFTLSVRLPIGIPWGERGGSKRQGNDVSFILLPEIKDLYSHSRALQSPAAEKPI